jgi:hypothetical protein
VGWGQDVAAVDHLQNQTCESPTIQMNAPACPSMPRENNMQYFETRTYIPAATNRMHLRSRPAALFAKDFICLQTIHNAIEGVMQSCISGITKPKKAQKVIRKLALLRETILLPKSIFCAVHRGIKNNTIATITGGDDDFYNTFRVNRDEMLILFNAMRAPPVLRLQFDHAGVVSSEFAFILFLYYNKGHTLAGMQEKFGIDYSRISICIHAFEIFLFDAHSFRVTDSWHFWASRVEAFNSALRNKVPPPPAGFEQIWAVGIDACLVNWQQYLCISLF